MKKIFGIFGLILTILLFWYVDKSNPEDKKIMNKETKKEWRKAKKEASELVNIIKEEFNNDSIVNEMKEDVVNTFNPDTLGKKIKGTYEWGKENIVEPAKDYIEDVKDVVTE